MQEIIEAPVSLSGVHFGYIGESLPARLVAVRKGGMNVRSNWYHVNGWVTQVKGGAAFRCPQWPRGGYIFPADAFGYPFVVTVAHGGMQPSWKGFQAGITTDRNVAHLVCIDTSKRV